MKITQSYFNLILKNYYLFENQPKIAVAVSGGPDSMALLFLLNKWIQTPARGTCSRGVPTL